MKLLTTKYFNGHALDCYIEPEQEHSGDFWATREQIGTLLGYEYPREAIGKIHQRNKERLDKFSTEVNLTTEAGLRTATIYSFKGLLEICRYSNQPKANDIMDWLFDVADEIRRTGNYSLYQSQDITPVLLESAKAVYQLAGLDGNQLVLAVDKYFKSYTGRSALEAAGIQLIAPTQNQLLNPTDIGKQYGLSAVRVNQILAGAGFQHKIADKWEPLELGQPYAVMQDTGKLHSNGTPVRQLKWDSSILDVFEELLHQEEASA